MDNRKNYLSYAFYATLLVVGLLLCVSLIPETEVLGIKLKRADILSDLRRKPRTEADPLIEHTRTPASQLEDMTRRNPALQKEEKERLAAEIEAILRTTDSTIVTIEDLSPDLTAMDRFMSAVTNISSIDRPVRIAFLGDSFIEGDLFTCDVREILQDSLGGRGVGFVPLTSQVAGFRETVIHTFHRWESYSMLTSVPSELKEKFLISGYIFRPQEGASVRYETARSGNLQGVRQAELFFVNPAKTVIKAVINNDSVRVFRPESSDELQRIVIRSREPIKSLEWGFTDVTQFIGYGVSMNNNTGVVVDNYSMRGNSGMSLVRIGRGINRQFNKMMRYDLIVLQFGLNVVTEGRTDYSEYKTSMVKAVNKLRESYPETSFILMSVGDRSAKTEESFSTMPEIRHMIRVQREIARECGIAFWNTYLAMGGDNSMVSFVRKGWAAKDHTHIGKAGGYRIAGKFVQALAFERQKYELIRKSLQESYSGEQNESAGTREFFIIPPDDENEKEGVLPTETPASAADSSAKNAYAY